MKRLFVSDVHLADADDVHFDALARLLAASRTDEVYLLGDLCEVWIGDDDDGHLARRLVDLLAQTSRRTRVFVMHGNRDFLYGSRFEARSGATLITDPYQVGDGTVLAHGDAFCTGDTAYQAARRTLRSSAWQAEVLSRGLPERRALAEQMRRQSQASNANKAENIMDVADAEVARVMREHDASVLIHGHTHRPGIHDESWGRRIVLGPWERCAWALAQDGTRFELRCFGFGSGAVEAAAV